MMVHFFETSVAKECGVQAAAVLQHIVFWVEKNRANEKHFYDGRYWTYSTVKAMTEIFPYLSKGQINRAIDTLVDKGYVIEGAYNKNPMDRTKWFTISQKCEMHLAESRNGVSENEKCSNISINNIDIYTDKRITDKEECIVTDVTICEKPVSHASDMQEIVDAWNALSGLGIPQISRMSPSSQRYKWTKARLAQYGKAEVLRAVENVSHSYFLRSGRFNFTYDWFIRPNNFIKVLDGNYLDKDYKPELEVKTEEPEPEKSMSPEEWIAMMERTYGDSDV